MIGPYFVLCTIFTFYNFLGASPPKKVSKKKTKKAKTSSSQERKHTMIGHGLCRGPNWATEGHWPKGKKHASKKYDRFALNTSCFWGSTGSNITPVVQFHKKIVTKIMNEWNYYYCWSKNFVKLHKSAVIFFCKISWNQNLKTASTGSSITLIKYFAFPQKTKALKH